MERYHFDHVVGKIVREIELADQGGRRIEPLHYDRILFL